MKQKVSVVVCLLVLFASFLFGASITRADDVVPVEVSSDGVVSIEISPEEERETRKMWTRRARMQAQPLDTMAVTAEQLAAAIADMDALPSDGAPGFAIGSAPEPQADAQAQAAFPEEWAAAQGSDGVLSTTAIPFTSFLGNYYSNFWKTYPYRMIGRINYQMPTATGGWGSSWCTATPIGPNTIVTAAHCVFDTQRNIWYRNFSFCPAYRNGACPYGQFAWKKAWIPPQYLNAAAFHYGIRYDVAVLELGPNGVGKGVHQMVGYLSRSWNQPYVQNVRTIGYPQKFYGGKYSWICQSSTIFKAVDIMEMGCNSGGGHSGGPWIRGFGSSNIVNNVMSYESVAGNPYKIMGAARFSSYNIVPLCNLAPGC